jgi:hypothetical protein
LRFMPHGDGRLSEDPESVARAGGLSIKQDHELPVRTCDSVPGQTVEAIGVMNGPVGKVLLTF